MTSAEMWLGCDTEMKTNTLKVGDKVKVIKPVVIAGTNLLGFTGTVECLASAGVDAVYVDYGGERAVDFFFFDELELIQ